MRYPNWDSEARGVNSNPSLRIQHHQMSAHETSHFLPGDSCFASELSVKTTFPCRENVPIPKIPNFALEGV